MRLDVLYWSAQERLLRPPTEVVLSAGQMKVIEVLTNGITFIGAEGIMKGAVMNFRIRSGASRTFLNVHTTGPRIEPGLQDTARWFMEAMASDRASKCTQAYPDSALNVGGLLVSGMPKLVTP